MSVGTSLRTTTAERASKRAHHAYIALGFQKPHVVQSRAYPGWQQRESRSKPGRFFYYNPGTDEKRWDRPAKAESLEVTGSFAGSRSASSLAGFHANLANAITHEVTVEQPSAAVVHDASLPSDYSTRSSRSSSADGSRDEAIQHDTVTLPLQMARPTTTAIPAAPAERFPVDLGYGISDSEAGMAHAWAPPARQIDQTDQEVVRPAQRTYQEESKPATETWVHESRKAPPAAAPELQEVRSAEGIYGDGMQAIQQTHDQISASSAPLVGGRPSDGSIVYSVISEGSVARSVDGASSHGFIDVDDDISACFGLTKDKTRWARCADFWEEQQEPSQPSPSHMVYQPYTHEENRMHAVKFLRHQLRRFFVQRDLANLGRAVRRKTELPKMEDLSWLDSQEIAVVDEDELDPAAL